MVLINSWTCGDVALANFFVARETQISLSSVSCLLCEAFRHEWRDRAYKDYDQMLSAQPYVFRAITFPALYEMTYFDLSSQCFCNYLSLICPGLMLHPTILEEWFCLNPKIRAATFKSPQPQDMPQSTLKLSNTVNETGNILVPYSNNFLGNFRHQSARAPQIHQPERVTSSCKHSLAKNLRRLTPLGYPLHLPYSFGQGASMDGFSTLSWSRNLQAPSVHLRKTAQPIDPTKISLHRSVTSPFWPYWLMQLLSYLLLSSITVN